MKYLFFLGGDWGGKATFTKGNLCPALEKKRKLFCIVSKLPSAQNNLLPSSHIWDWHILILFTN
jgi:hypothetical protein